MQALNQSKLSQASPLSLVTACYMLTACPAGAMLWLGPHQVPVNAHCFCLQRILACGLVLLDSQLVMQP